MNDDPEFLELKLDMNAAYRAAVERLQKRTADSQIPGSMLSEDDVQKIVNEALTSLIELALITRAVKPNGDHRADIRHLMLQLVDMVIGDYDRIAKSIRRVEFHAEPKPTH